MVDEVRNPYSPGAGRRPSALVGRDRQIRTWEVAVARTEEDRTAQPVVLYGLRGVGKTVLLSQFAHLARQRDWIVAQVEAGVGKGLRESLGEALHAPLADLARPGAGKRLLRALKTALTFKASYDTVGGAWNFGLDLSEVPGGGADTGYLETDLTKLVRDLSQAAAEESTGVALLIDEAQDLTGAELQALCSIAHIGGQEGWRCLIGLAGLPSLPRMLAEAKSYSERLFAFERIEHLTADVALQALIDPAVQEGTEWQRAAADYVVEQASGYPYFLQQFGQETWNCAAGPDLEIGDAREGCAAGRAVLDAGFFRARWDRATRSEQKYLHAMSIDGDHGSSSGEVAARLGGRVTSFGPVRANLIAKGLIYAPEHGVVAFTVPGMADFIKRQPSG